MKSRHQVASCRSSHSLLLRTAWLILLVPAATQAQSATDQSASRLRGRPHAMLRPSGCALQQLDLAVTERKQLAIAAWSNQLALVYGAQGRYAEAEPLFRRDLAIREQATPGDATTSPSPTASTTWRACTMPRAATPRPSRSSNGRCPSSRGRVDLTTPTSPGTLNNLGGLYVLQARYPEAEPLYRRSLAIQEKARGPNHPDVAGVVNNLGSLYCTLGRKAEAEVLCKRGLAIYQKALGPDHPEVATSLLRLAEVYRTQDRHAEAITLHERALAIFEKALGLDRLEVARCLSNLAFIYVELEQPAEAESRYLRALRIREKMLGVDHPDVASSLDGLASVYLAQARYAEAEALRKRALTIREKSARRRPPRRRHEPGKPGYVVRCRSPVRRSRVTAQARGDNDRENCGARPPQARHLFLQSGLGLPGSGPIHRGRGTKQ